MARVEEMDALRGFAILGVIAIHVSINMVAIPKVNGLAVALIEADIFSHFAVPLFIFISGFVLTRKYRDGFSLNNFYRKRALSVVPQYLIFSIFYLAGKTVLFGPMAAGAVLFSLLTASSSYHLWFFAVIIELYLLYPLIRGIYRRAGDKIALLLLGALALQVLWEIINYLIGAFYHPLFLLSQRVFLSQIFYFLIGMYVAENYGRVKGVVRNMSPVYPACVAIILTGAISLTWIQGFNTPATYGLFTAQTLVLIVAPRLVEPLLYLAIMILCLQGSYYLMERKAGPAAALRSIGKCSFGIYLIHVFFLTVGAMGLQAIGISPTAWTFYPLLFAMALASSYASVYLLSFLPASRMLTGTHNTLKEKVLAIPGR